MPGYTGTVMGLEVEALPRIKPRPDQVQVLDDGKGMGRLEGLPGGRGVWRSICIGAPRGEAMVSFALATRATRMITPPGPPTLRVGFIQTLLSTKRIATYMAPTAAAIMTPTVFTIERDSTLVGNGLLDCGGSAPPWFQGVFHQFDRPVQPPTKPVTLRAFDNPRWSLPLALSIKGGRSGVLKRIEMEDRFRLFIAASDGRSYYPLAWIDWATEITYTPNPGQITDDGPLPPGVMLGARVYADQAWQPPGTLRPVVTGTRANELLVDRLQFSRD